MAEAAAAIGLVASIASLVDLSAKIVSRVRDYSAQATDVPKTLRSLADRLPSLTQTLKQVQAQAQGNYIPADAAKDFEALVHSILEHVKQVERYLASAIPTSEASRIERILTGIKSVAKDEKLKQAVTEIHRGIDVLVLHQVTRAVEAGDLARRESGRKGLSPQTFGLCLGHAPLIDPDMFVGRQGEVRQLHEWLSPSLGASNQRIVSIVGMGGLGKTQLALAYAREHGREYSSVFWLSAQDETSLRQSMSALSAVIFPDSAITVANTNEETIQVDKVRRWFSEEGNGQWLIIFDNYDDPSLPNFASPTGFDIRRFFPTRTQGSLLITTRSSKLAFSKLFKLQKLANVDIGVTILSRRSGRDMAHDPGAQRLVDRLDGLPLAVAVAGTYLAQVDTSCTEYLDLYETAWNDLHGPDTEVLMEYTDRTLSSTWTVSLDRVRSQDADAAELVQFFGYLHNDHLGYELIAAGADTGPSWMGRVTANKIRFDRAMSKLGDYSLVEAHGGAYRVHPCLHDWIVERLNTPPSDSLFVAAVACIKRSIPDAQSLQFWTTSRRLIKHIKRTQHPRFTHLWDSNNSDAGILDASLSFGVVYLDLSELDSAEVTLLRALSGYEKVRGPDHDSTLSACHSLGLLYYDQGKLDKAEQMTKRALVGYEKMLGPDDIDTLGTLNNLGLVYHSQGKLDEAEQTYQRAVAGKEKLVGIDRIDTLKTLKTLNNLGRLYGRARVDAIPVRYLTSSPPTRLIAMLCTCRWRPV